MRSLTITLCIAALAAFAPSVSAIGDTVPAPLLPDREWAMIRQIAANYSLSEDKTWLLAAIRCHENGRAGKEFGVGEEKDHIAHRYRDGFKSFYVQGSWAAGTINRNYRGNIQSFARRYCPSDAHNWSASVSRLVKTLRRQYDNRLPGLAYGKRKVPFLRRGLECTNQ